MQTFLPYPDFSRSLHCLDTKRLGKQRVEAMQIINTLTRGHSQAHDHATPSSAGWSSHPAVVMWRGFLPALTHYHNVSILVWVERGYKNTMALKRVDGPLIMPPWFGDDQFHASHRSNLLRKLPSHYSQFGWSEPPDMEYFWPGDKYVRD